MTLRSTAIALFSAALLFSATSEASAQVKVGVVDLQRALNETEDGRKAKGKLKKLFESRQKTLDKQQNELRMMKEDLEKQKDVLSRDVLGKKLETYQKKFAELQRTYMEFQQELGSKEADLTKDILLQMQQIARRIGLAKGYTIILDGGEAGIVYVDTTYDLTDELIRRYNAGEGKQGGKGKGKKSKGKKK